MRAVVQRVLCASVSADGVQTGAISHGLLVLLGVMQGDTADDGLMLAQKIIKLRIFSDEDGKLNRSLLDTAGEMLIVSNFTLAADYRHGNRPDYFSGAAPALAESLYLSFIDSVRSLGVTCATGKFGADMRIDMTANGPVTIVMDTDVLKSKKKA